MFEKLFGKKPENVNVKDNAQEELAKQALNNVENVSTIIPEGKIKEYLAKAMSIRDKDPYFEKIKGSDQYKESVATLAEELYLTDTGQIEKKHETGQFTGSSSSERIDKRGEVMETIANNSDLSKSFDAWSGKVDTAGNSMQEKFINFIAKNPGETPGYDKTTEDFRPATIAGGFNTPQ